MPRRVKLPYLVRGLPRDVAPYKYKERKATASILGSEAAGRKSSASASGAAAPRPRSGRGRPLNGATS